jgi:hypothetical protein
MGTQTHKRAIEALEVLLADLNAYTDEIEAAEAAAKIDGRYVNKSAWGSAIQEICGVELALFLIGDRPWSNGAKIALEQLADYYLKESA